MTVNAPLLLLLAHTLVTSKLKTGSLKANEKTIWEAALALALLGVIVNPGGVASAVTEAEAVELPVPPTAMVPAGTATVTAPFVGDRRDQQRVVVGCIDGRESPLRPIADLHHPGAKPVTAVV